MKGVNYVKPRQEGIRNSEGNRDCLLVLLAAIIALPFFLDVNQFKPELQSKLSSALGREVSVGKLKLSLLSGNVAVEEISVADNPSFSRSPFVNAQSLKVGIELKPLIFSKSIRITGITLDHPSITLIRSPSGQWNFSDLGGGSEPKATSSGLSGQSNGFSGEAVSIQQLKITGGRITIVNGRQQSKPSVYNNVDIRPTICPTQRLVRSALRHQCLDRAR